MPQGRDLQKRIKIPTSYGFSIIVFQIYREILKKYTNRAIGLEKKTILKKFERNLFSQSHE